MSACAEVRSVAIGRQVLRVSVRPGLPSASGIQRVPLLLINGIGASLELLQPFVDQLDPAVEVIRFDPPGVGGSPPPGWPYRFSGLCRLIAAMLTELGYDRVDVLGISWGGGVAQHFAAFQRARCRRLVLVATATGTPMVPARPSVLIRLVTPRRYLDPDYLTRVAGDLYGGLARIDSAEIVTAMHNGNRVGPSRGYVYQLTAAAGWASLPLLPWLRQPTLILAGDDDPIIPLANARLMHWLIRDSTLHVYHGGHLALVTEAAELAPVVNAFLAEPLTKPHRSERVNWYANRGPGPRAPRRERHPAGEPRGPVRGRLRGDLLLRGHPRDQHADRRPRDHRPERVRVSPANPGQKVCRDRRTALRYLRGLPGLISSHAAIRRTSGPARAPAPRKTPLVEHGAVQEWGIKSHSATPMRR
jgi:poly(3-hydroxyalkanoate) depolymerase